MSATRTERQLRDVGARLRALRDELGVGQEQLVQVRDEADDARVRALVSETPLAVREHREAQRVADKLARHLDGVRTEIAKLESHQDALLDRLAADGGRR